MKIQKTGRPDKEKLFVYLPIDMIKHLGLKKGDSLDYLCDVKEVKERGTNVRGLRTVIITRQIDKWD